MDLAQGAIRVPQHKLTRITAGVRRLLSTSPPTARRVAPVRGKIYALASAVPHIRLPSNLLQRQVERGSRGSAWDARLNLPPAVRQQLEEVIPHLVAWKGRDLSILTP